MRKLIQIGGLFLGVAVLGGCTTINPYTGEKEISKTAIGSGTGALGGALLGQLVGGDTTSTLVGAGLGAAVGGIAGNYMDRQDAALREQLQGSGVQIKRVGRDIRLVMPGDITFENDRSDIRSDFYATLNSVGVVLKKFSQTTVRVAGYASRTGNAMYNQEISERRARAVADYLIAQGVDSARVMAVGHGARHPIASNDTQEGQARNRRVEITIHALSR